MQPLSSLASRTSGLFDKLSTASQSSSPIKRAQSAEVTRTHYSPIKASASRYTLAGASKTPKLQRKKAVTTLRQEPNRGLEHTTTAQEGDWIARFTAKSAKKLDLITSISSFQTVVVSKPKNDLTRSNYGFLGMFDFEHNTTHTSHPAQPAQQEVQGVDHGSSSSPELDAVSVYSDSIANISDTSSMSDWSIVINPNNPKHEPEAKKAEAKNARAKEDGEKICEKMKRLGSF